MATGSKQTAPLTGDRSAASTPQSLIDRRELTFIAVERTRLPMIVSDPRQADNPIVMANKAFLDSMGFTVDQVIGRNCRFLQGPDTDPETVRQIRQAIIDEQDLTVEILNYRKDGSPFWNELYLSPIYDDDDELVYYFASQQDVSARRRMHDLEAAENVLLREIEHRAKNALALVQGIVRLSQADTVTEFADRVQGRVDALAKAHTVLAEARWRDVPIDRLIKAEVEPFGTQRVKMDGPPIEIAAVQVQPLALVLHEVIANAVHHGALSTDNGTLSIQWRPHEGWTNIEMREIGGPPPANDRKSGFGMKIMDAIVRRQLRGSVDFTWQPDGLTSVLRVPQTVAV